MERCVTTSNSLAMNHIFGLLDDVYKPSRRRYILLLSSSNRHSSTTETTNNELLKNDFSIHIRRFLRDLVGCGQRSSNTPWTVCTPSLSYTPPKEDSPCRCLSIRVAMAPVRRHYLTLNGQPPNGGFPPGWIPPAAVQPVAPPQPVAPLPSPYVHPPYVPPTYGPPCIPPRPDYGYGFGSFLPGPALVAPRPDTVCLSSGYLPFWAMEPGLPGPPAPPPPPPPGFPRGTYIDGATVRFESNMNYLFPEQHTVIHFFLDGFKPWEHQGMTHTWAAFKVSTMMTVNELIRQLRCKENNEELDCISECIEVGDGVWLRGSSFKLGEDNSNQTLEALGWNEARGTVSKPVWLALYKL